MVSSWGLQLQAGQALLPGQSGPQGCAPGRAEEGGAGSPGESRVMGEGRAGGRRRAEISSKLGESWEAREAAPAGHTRQPSPALGAAVGPYGWFDLSVSSSVKVGTVHRAVGYCARVADRAASWGTGGDSGKAGGGRPPLTPLDGAGVGAAG